MKQIYSLIILFLTLIAQAGTLRCMSYNVENLFDMRHDSLYNDFEYIEDGLRNWSYSRYRHKTEQIARVVANAAQWDTIAIIGLQEVENDWCLDGLCYQLRNIGYRYIHFESLDERGIDVAMLYMPNLIQVIDSMPVKVDIGKDRTRDILYAKVAVKTTSDTLHILVCHLPSMLGGAAASSWKRERAKRTIEHLTDSIFATQAHAHILVMGDMNNQPHEDIQGMHNRMTDIRFRHIGTHKYQGIWTCLDQVYLSPSLDSISEVRIYNAPFLLESDKAYLGTRPKRTYVGYKYQKDGFSDHLPVLLDINLNKNLDY